MEKSWDFSLEVKKKRQRGRIKQKLTCFSYWLDKVPNLFFLPCAYPNQSLGYWGAWSCSLSLQDIAQEICLFSILKLKTFGMQRRGTEIMTFISLRVFTFSILVQFLALQRTERCLLVWMPYCLVSLLILSYQYILAPDKPLLANMTLVTTIHDRYFQIISLYAQF